MQGEAQNGWNGRQEEKSMPLGTRPVGMRTQSTFAIYHISFSFSLERIRTFRNFAFRRTSGGDSPAPFIAVKGYSSGSGWLFHRLGYVIVE